MSRKILQIDESRFIALAQLGMPVFWNWGSGGHEKVFVDRDPREELDEYRDAGGNEQMCTFWTLVEADGHS